MWILVEQFESDDDLQDKFGYKKVQGGSQNISNVIVAAESSPDIKNMTKCSRLDQTFHLFQMSAM